METLHVLDAYTKKPKTKFTIINSSIVKYFLLQIYVLELNIDSLLHAK